MEDPALAGRSWRWLRARITGLLTTPVAGWREVHSGDHARHEPLWATRIQSVLHTSPEADA